MKICVEGRNHSCRPVNYIPHSCPAAAKLRDVGRRCDATLPQLGGGFQSFGGDVVLVTSSGAPATAIVPSRGGVGRMGQDASPLVVVASVVGLPDGTQSAGFGRIVFVVLADRVGHPRGPCHDVARYNALRNTTQGHCKMTHQEKR